MNTPLDHDSSPLRYAEYVLGVLDADARAEVAREMLISDEAAAAVTLWHRRLQPMSEEIPSVQPPDRVWRRIQQSLRREAPAREAAPPARGGLWGSLRFWQGLGLGASALAAACLLLLCFSWGPRVAPPSAPVAFMAATITQSDGHVGWTATMDLERARIVVVPVASPSFAPGKAPQLWLIPAGQKPISIGMITSRTPTTLALDRSLLSRLGPTASLAVSVEPGGGSPTGQPTGPVVATGTIGAASG